MSRTISRRLIVAGEQLVDSTCSMPKGTWERLIHGKVRSPIGNLLK